MGIKIKSEHASRVRSMLSSVTIDEEISRFYMCYRDMLLGFVTECLSHDGCRSSRRFMMIAQHLRGTIVPRAELLELLKLFNKEMIMDEIEGELYPDINRIIKSYLRKDNPTTSFEAYLENHIIYGLKDILADYYLLHGRRSMTEELQDDIPDETDQTNYYRLTPPWPVFDLTRLKPLYAQILLNTINDPMPKHTVVTQGFIEHELHAIECSYSKAIKELRNDKTGHKATRGKSGKNNHLP